MISLFDDENTEDFLRKYLLIDIDDTTYAFKIEYVKEIIPIIDMFTIDTLDNNITGLVNLRGTTIPVYDLRGFLGKENLPLSIHQKFLILNIDTKNFALIIDNVGEIIDIADEDISQLDYSETLNFLNTTVIDNKTIIIIDVNNFFNYTKTAQNVKKANSTEIISTEKVSVDKVKNRIALLNEKSHYQMQEDAFLNEKFIIFKLNEEIYAFNISCVKEIKKIPTSTINKIPCVPDFILGIINFRGDYVSLIDIKPFLTIPKTPLKEKTDIIILKINNLKLGIIIDEIIDITTISIANMTPENNREESFIIGELPYNDTKMINILNVEKLFSSDNVNIENYE